MTSPPLWKASLVLAKEDAPNASAAFEIALPAPQAVLIFEEPFQPNATVEALYDEAPDADFLSRVLGRAVTVAPLPDQDWIRLSQEGLPPVRAGRFFVYGAHDKGQVPPAVVPLAIEAGLAFGTGHHETTALCLAAFSALAKGRRFSRILDVGCGTGLLAIGAARVTGGAAMATDIDPVAVQVTQDNARANGMGRRIRAFAADGLEHPAVTRAAPFDLVFANILASPLTRLAPQLSRAVMPGGVAILSGLLRWQENLVLSFYRPHGMVLRRTWRDGPWSALVLERVRR